MQIKFCMSHVHAFFMHTSFLSFLFLCFWLWLCSLSFSLSLSRIDYAWHPKHVSPLQLRILLVPGLLLLILSPLFTFVSVMRKPKRTSWRTFKNVAFIWSTMLFCQIFLTFLSPPSFRLGVGNLYMRDPWGIPSCLYMSFTPIYTVSISQYFGLPLHVPWVVHPDYPDCDRL